MLLYWRLTDSRSRERSLKNEDDGQHVLKEVVNGDQLKGDAEIELINCFKNRQ